MSVKYHDLNVGVTLGGGGGSGNAFLEAEATTYLDTGVAGNSVYKMVFHFTPITVANAYQGIIVGAIDNLTVASMDVNSGLTSGYIRCGNVDFGVVTYLIGQINTLVCEGGKVTLNGNQLAGTFTGPINTTSDTIKLFGNATASRQSHSRVYLCELYDNSGNLLKQLIPSEDSNYIPCMLDTVSNTKIYGISNRLTFGYKL